MKLGVTMPTLNAPYEELGEMAADADAAGFDSLWDYEFYRNPFVIHGISATRTSRIQLCTGIANAVSRTPFEMANAAADVDEISGGRMLLGIGTGGPLWVDFFHGADLSKPVSLMREYVEVLRAAWDHLASGEPASHQGERYRFASPPLNPWGPRAMARPRIPVYLAAMRPRMLALAGEVADGILSYLCPPRFAAEHIGPHVAAGAERAGRDPAEVELTALTICSVSEDREEAMRRARIQVGMYVAYPISDVVVEAMGLQDEVNAVREALLGEGPGALERVTSDELVRTFSIAGTPEECREQLRDYEGVIPHVVLHTPYVPPLSGTESIDSFRNIVAAFGPAGAEDRAEPAAAPTAAG